jgi:hypothetical protein
MVISGLRYREIYPQNELSWELSLEAIPTTGDTNFKFYFSGLNSGLLEIFNLKNKKVYSNDGKLLGGYNDNVLINFSGEIGNNYYSLYQNNKNLFIGHPIPNYFDENFVKGFVLESLDTNFINFKSLKILGERPEYFIDYTSNFEYLEVNIPIHFYNSGEFSFLIYSGKSLDNSFKLSGINNLFIPATGSNSFTLINSNFLNNYKKVPIVLYSEIGILKFNLDLNGFKIDESTYYLTFGPPTNIVRNNTNIDYLLSFYNINQTNLVIEFKHVSGLTGDYRTSKFVKNDFSSEDQILNYTDNSEKTVKDFEVSGFIFGSGFLTSPIDGTIKYFNPINDQVESGFGIGEAQNFIFATPIIEFPIKLLQTFQSSGANGNFGDSSLLKDNYIFVGEPEDSSLFLNNGSIHIFEKNSVNSYNFQQKINNPETGSNNNFGFSFSSNFNNRRLFISSLKDQYLGAVYFYGQDTSTKFNLKQKISYTGGDFYTFDPRGYCFGYSVANNLSGDKLFISAINDSYLYLDINQQDHGSINIYKTSIDSVINNIYDNYYFDRKITGELNFNNSNLFNFGEYIYTNEEGDLIFTNNHNEYTNLIYIFKEENNEWILKQTINTLNTGNRYFYVNKNCSILGVFEKYIDEENILSIYKSSGSQWELSQRFTGILNNNTKFIINEDESILIFKEDNLKVFTGNHNQYNLAAYIENNIQDNNSKQNSIIASHDSTTIGSRSGNYFNLYRYSPPNFAEFTYNITLTGIGDADLFTDIPAKAFIKNLKYSGPVTYLGGFLTGFFASTGTGVQRDDYFGWEYDNRGILRPPTTLNTNTLDTLCRFRPELSICQNRQIFDINRPIITGFITGIDTKFVNYTGIIYADYSPSDLTTVTLISPLTSVTGRETGFFDIFGFALASGIPGRISGKILGDFAQFFEPGTWTITKSWGGTVSGNEFLNLLDTTAFDIRLLTIKKYPTSGFIITGLKKEITFADFCTEDLSKFPPFFEISGVTPTLVKQIPDFKRPYDPRSYQFAKDVFAVSPILSGVEWQYENSEFQLQSGFQFIFSGYPFGGRTRISRLGYTISGDGYFNNLFQLPFFAKKKENGQYISQKVSLEDKESVGLFNNYKIQKTDINGNLLLKTRLDFLGNPEFKQRKKCKIIRDSNGDPLFDNNGNTIPIPSDPLTLVNSFDEEGNPIVDINGNPILTYDCEPERDTEGNILIEYFYKDEDVIYNDLTVDLNNFYINLSGIRLNKDKYFYLTINGLVSNSNIIWESAFENTGPWTSFILYDNITGFMGLTELNFNFSNKILSGKLPFNSNYFRVRAVTTGPDFLVNFPEINFSGTQKSLIPILVPDYYEITNNNKFAGWEESLNTVDLTLYDTGLPPCIETINTPAFFLDPCDVTILKFNIIKPTFYKSGEKIREKECFERCFSNWPKTQSIFAYSGFFSGYISNFIYNISENNYVVRTPLKFGRFESECCFNNITTNFYRNKSCDFNLGCPLYKDIYLNPANDGYYREISKYTIGVNPKWYRIIDGIIVEIGVCENYDSSSSSSSTLCSGDNIYVLQIHTGNCAIINPIRIYTNNNSFPISIQITGNVDNDLLINDEIYEDGFYPYRLNTGISGNRANFWQFNSDSSCNNILSNFRIVYNNGNVFAHWGDGNISGLISNVNYNHTFSCNSISCIEPSKNEINGPHTITPYHNIIEAGSSLKIGIQSYGEGYIFGNLCVVTGFVDSSSSSSSDFALTRTESMWVSVDSAPRRIKII